VVRMLCRARTMFVRAWLTGHGRRHGKAQGAPADQSEGAEHHQHMSEEDLHREHSSTGLGFEQSKRLLGEAQPRRIIDR
jgi:hypothetical protein